ncbi:hypothetical protein [Pseudoalteromonas luteoviolacea]|uniref:Uncharacterized protein n=1 Tax=Pseudoalteromonas luteoviolacea S4054 TaxID=1129367 RepID=A0A0F6A986_9GAMM|nr:hypothetical protein [Pseudoalteromonas luteoviolacea]AOT06905.1 hypothetical protein S4054249_03000 [Pseudoalteromonas luteoviolacea]AOT11823.1 hypothetical protein S40542_03000 [Pseudoalteromonas luteoviolacea]AOT16735.1 hypothetical protein S4054_03000 [Pseudoalteromonas luteoviolacea]KKE82767.1 hypothetical protein N479_17070 [Pseudoalteromonas luteoviolacea S4054]KZN72978.1 hypothetical protein N481_14075 [Pseudoalteromonas luteoviolacea S4047-1]
MFQQFRCIAITCSLIVFNKPAMSASSEHIHLVESALERFSQTNKQHWSYTVHSIEIEEGKKTEIHAKHQPNKDASQRWQLLLFNGQEPSQQQAKEFAQRREDEGFSISIKELVKTHTLSLTQETPNSITFSYPVELADLGSDAIGKLTGHIRIDKKSQHIEQISVRNTATFSPVALADISDFNLTMQFMTVNNAVLVQRTQMDMRGTFSFFIDIEETSTVTFDNYRHEQISKIEK